LTSSGFAGPLNGTVGATTPASGAFTTVSASGNVTLSGGTANGVAYLDGSKVLTTGSALSFDGTSLDLGTVGAKVNFATTGSATRNFIGLSADGYSLEMVTQRGAIQPLSYKQDFGAGHIWSIAASEQMRLTSTGLGIGTSSPSTSLQVGDATTSGKSITLRNGGGASRNAYITLIGTTAASANQTWYSGVNAFASDGSYEIKNAAGNGLTLDPSANLGLGVTPSAWSSASRPALQLPNGAALFSRSGSTFLGQNFFYNNSDTGSYIANGFATAYYQASGQHIWFNAPSGTAGNTAALTQAMTLDASGRLGIGITAPSAGIQIQGTTTNNLAALRVTNSTGGLLNADFDIRIDDGGSVQLKMYGAYPMQFFTNNTERARIDSSGNFRLGNTTGGTRRMQVESASSNYTIGLYNTNATPYGFYSEYSTSPNDIGSHFFVGIDSTTTRVELRSNGGIANYSGNNVNLSDRREKTNFAAAKSYLDVICAIPVQTFNYIDQNMENDGGLTLGVVAQDVQAVAPELVMESNWGTKDEPKMRLSIYQTDLQYALMKCIQEQQALIQDLTTRLAALEAK
jgi:hypothetical protein